MREAARLSWPAAMAWVGGWTCEAAASRSSLPGRVGWVLGHNRLCPGTKHSHSQNHPYPYWHRSASASAQHQHQHRDWNLWLPQQDRKLQCFTMAAFLPPLHKLIPRSDFSNPLPSVPPILFAVVTGWAVLVLYTHRHRPVHCLGWGYLVAFCILGTVGEAIHLSDPSSPVPSTISNSATTLLTAASVCIIREASVFLSCILMT